MKVRAQTGQTDRQTDTQTLPNALAAALADASNNYTYDVMTLAECR